MTSDEVFVNGVWEKYDNYMSSNAQEKFFRKHQYKNTEIKRKLGTIVSFILGIIATTGVVYASVAIHNALFSQKDTKTDFINNPGYQYYQNMQYTDGIYYKRIYSYDEYIESTKIWHNLVEMNEKDFQESFVLIIAGQNYKTTGLYISNIYVKNDKTCVELKRKDKWSKDTTVISAKISNELNRKEIEIKNIPNIIPMPKNYKDLNEITIEYTIEQALTDGCIVIENYGEIISDNKSELDEFLEKKENGVLRIYKYGKEYFSVIDIQYDDGVVNINDHTFNLLENKSNPIVYFTGNRITKIGFYNEYTDYTCVNELGDVRIICTIKEK